MAERNAIAAAREGNHHDAHPAGRSVLWRRLDLPGHEAAFVFFLDDLWHLSGSAVFAYDGRPCRLDYLVLCDPKWRTLSAKVAGWIGCEPVDIEISTDSNHRWRLNHQECPEAAGCIDVDLNFSPATNLLPIRRLDLFEGQESQVRAAWLHFPSLQLEPLEQVYRRIGERTYSYQNTGRGFVAEIEVDEFGLVTCYPGLWQVEAHAATRNV